VLGKIADAVKSVFQYLQGARDDKKAKEKKKEAESAEKELDHACDKGDLQDLIDAAGKYGDVKKNVAKALAAAFLGAACCGCSTLDVTTTRPYEGRYDDTAKAIKALSGAELKRGESVWILSNETLKYILKRSGN